jgi:hypothetical protein
MSLIKYARIVTVKIKLAVLWVEIYSLQVEISDVDKTLQYSISDDLMKQGIELKRDKFAQLQWLINEHSKLKREQFAMKYF